MQKAASWIVQKRTLVLIVMLILTAICAVLTPMVQINSDMTKYLPDDSAMRKGMSLMNEEFAETEQSSTIRLMLKGLTDAQKAEILQELKDIPNVSSVTYEQDSADYNKDDYTLYVLSTAYGYKTKEEKAIESTLTAQYAAYNAKVANDDTSSPEIPVTVYVAAFAIILIVLFIACESYLEPLLFLITIGIAVVLNLGTNIIFGEVSDVTAGVAAILQLALSMDYSIILMNRYRQELRTTDDRIQAMEKALSASFSAITGSALTTIVGLLMLLFMSFKIGQDIGLVLAKGVTFSMVCVFTVLPALILAFHKGIEKTLKHRRVRTSAKKTLLEVLGDFSFKHRTVIAVCFVLLFVGGYFLQRQTATVYTLTDVDTVAEVFPVDNQLVLLYENEDENAIAALADELSENASVRSVTGYPNTLGKAYTAEEMAAAFSAMSEDMTVPAEAFRLIYYAYAHQNETQTMTLSAFVSFVETLTENPLLSEYTDTDMLSQLSFLKALADKETIETPMTASAMAQQLGMNSMQLTQLYKIRFGDNYSQDSTMSIREFAVFMTDTVLNNKVLSAMFDENTKASLQTMRAVTDAVVSDTALTAQETAALLNGADEGIIGLAYLYQAAETQGDSAQTMTISEVMSYIVDDLLNDARFASVLNDSLRAQAADAAEQLQAAEKQLKGEHYSRLIITTTLPTESTETSAFITALREKCESDLSGEYYLIGTSAMVDEMEQGFDRELLVITLLTALSIFIVVAFTFRSLVIPVLLVLIVQCGVFITVSAIGVFGGSMYYLALLIVECILMGATIDYGILYTTYYREMRQKMEVKDALVAAYRGSIHTVLTSGSIMVLITALVGPLFGNPTIEAIVRTLAVGCLSAILLILLILPGLLALFDKWTGKTAK